MLIASQHPFKYFLKYFYLLNILSFIYLLLQKGNEHRWSPSLIANRQATSSSLRHRKNPRQKSVMCKCIPKASGWQYNATPFDNLGRSKPPSMFGLCKYVLQLIFAVKMRIRKRDNAWIGDFGFSQKCEMLSEIMKLIGGEGCQEFASIWSGKCEGAWLLYTG